MNTSANGIITHASPYSVAETIDRLEAILRAKNIKVFARIDHRDQAAQVGLQMAPTELLIFGDPKGGTPIMMAVPLSAIDLPLKALAWQDSDGKNWVSYNDPRYLKSRFSLVDDLMAPISGAGTLIQQAVS
jgi:uncharacterized protein (DUF302 family)